MQTLGLFGDSFVQDHRWGEFMFYNVLNITDEEKILKLRKEYQKAVPAWWELLHNYNATPHGVGGADNYCGLLNFLYNHEKYDRVIFLITETQRQSFWFEENKSPDNLTSDIHNSANNMDRWVHATNEAMCMSKRFGPFANKLLVKSYGVMKDYHATIGMTDRVKGNVFTNLIIEKIKKLRPDTLFINGFADENFIEDFFEFKKGTPLLELHQIDNKKLGKEGHWSDETDTLVDMRISHQSTPSNMRLARIVQRHLDNNKTLLEFDVEPFRHVKVDKNLVFVESNNPKSFTQHLDLLGIAL